MNLVIYLAAITELMTVITKPAGSTALPGGAHPPHHHSAYAPTISILTLLALGKIMYGAST